MYIATIFGLGFIIMPFAFLLPFSPLMFELSLIDFSGAFAIDLNGV